MTPPKSNSSDRLQVVILHGSAQSILEALPAILDRHGLQGTARQTPDGIEINIVNQVSDQSVRDESVGRVGSTFGGNADVISNDDVSVDSYQNVTGPGAKAYANQESTETTPQLIKELSTLLAEMQRRDDSAANAESVGAIASAQVASKHDIDVKPHLKKAGSWALKVATEIGTDVAAAAIKASAGI